MVAVAVEVTVAVEMVKVALLLPAATVTLAGGVAAGALLPSVTNRPPAGAGAVRVTVPWELVPPMTEAGASDTELTAGNGAGGLTASAVVFVTPAYVAEIVAVAVEVTVAVAMVKVALLLPAATVTLAGGVAEGTLLPSVTTRPPAGAGAVRVTVPCEVAPPVTVAGLTEIELRAGAITWG